MKNLLRFWITHSDLIVLAMSASCHSNTRFCKKLHHMTHISNPKVLGACDRLLSEWRLWMLSCLAMTTLHRFISSTLITSEEVDVMNCHTAEEVWHLLDMSVIISLLFKYFTCHLLLVRILRAAPSTWRMCSCYSPILRAVSAGANPH